MALGEILRKAREERQWTISDAAIQTNLMSKIITALEEEKFSQFPAPVYGRGFIVNYARVLNLNPEPLLEEYYAALGMQPPKTAKSYADAKPQKKMNSIHIGGNTVYPNDKIPSAVKSEENADNVITEPNLFNLHERESESPENSLFSRPPSSAIFAPQTPLPPPPSDAIKTVKLATSQTVKAVSKLFHRQNESIDAINHPGLTYRRIKRVGVIIIIALIVLMLALAVRYVFNLTEDVPAEGIPVRKIQETPKNAQDFQMVPVGLPPLK